MSILPPSNRMLALAYTVLLAGFAWLFATMPAAGARTVDAEAHIYFDRVLYPTFVSAANAYALKHPVRDDHAANFDAGDAVRFKELRRAFHEMDNGAKKMGY